MKTITINILSFGDRIAEGTYELHSAFDNVLNFEKQGMLAAVVTEKIGPGPFNIVVDALPAKAKKLYYKDACVRLDSMNLQFKKNCIYDSRLRILEVNPARFIKNLQILRKALSFKAPDKSLAFLLDEKREDSFSGRFEKKFLEKFKKGVLDLALGAYEKGASGVRGLGWGLTPSGDDFLSGYLLGISAAEKFSKKNLSIFKERVYVNSFGKNAVSNAFLKCSYEGRAGEKFKNLIAILSSDAKKGKIISAAEDIMNSGSTSGTDSLSGFFYGFYAAINL
ncbi:MAG: DUF2877 domain-containing protein [Elusimicrobia bacterium]|nr:DUF2877 domain-containing protein [Elusimicrobiota bacterium]